MAMGTEQTTARMVSAILLETVDSMAMVTEQLTMVSAILSETVDTTTHLRNENHKISY